MSQKQNDEEERETRFVFPSYFKLMGGRTEEVGSYVGHHLLLHPKF